MARPARNDVMPEIASPPAARPVRSEEPSSSAVAEHGYLAGGQVGRMHVDLVQRLAQHPGTAPATPPPAERMVRSLSVAGGYLALTAGYVGVALLLFR